MEIPFNNLKRGFIKYKEEYEKKVLEILESGWYILGKQVCEFEESFARIHGVPYCCGVGNGLNAIELGIKALGIGEGDEVILQANSYIATVMGITYNQAIPVFVEPDEYYNIDVSKIEEKISEKTKAVLVTHLYGQASYMEPIVDLCKRHGLYLLEDCAQSHFAAYDGKYTGSFGDVSFFSFYPTKNLGCFGDGGAILTSDENVNNKIRLLRNYGSIKKYQNDILGTNSRLDELQAGILNVKLKYVEQIISERGEIASFYLRNIKNEKIKLPAVREKASHVWYLFVIQTDERQRFREYMKGLGIQTEVHYPVPPHLSKAYAGLGYKRGSFPVTEAYADRAVSLPLFNGMKAEEMRYVADMINKYN